MLTQTNGTSGTAVARARSRKPAPQLGLLAWAERVVTEGHRVGNTFAVDGVHDLRVAIRRCRSMAEGLHNIDPVRDWKEFRTLAKPAFSALGQLRDIQIKRQWSAQLAAEGDAIHRMLDSALALRETQVKAAAERELADFDRKRWSKLARKLERRSRSMRPGCLVLQLVALEQMLEAQRLHERALKTRGATDIHQLRIGIKHFRYTVENFLPDHHRLWKNSLKRAQDLLGEIHDLDLLQDEIVRLPGLSAAMRDSWNARIASERTPRFLEYLEMTRADDLWAKWRAGLPSGRRLSMANRVKLHRWSAALDEDCGHTRRTAAIAVALWRNLRGACRWPSSGQTAQHLRMAAWLHGIGASKRRQKRLDYLAGKLAKLPTPVGWTEAEMNRVRLAVRFGSGAVPNKAEVEFQRLTPDMQRDVLRMSGVLRLADALDRATGGRDIRTAAEARDGMWLIRVSGFDELSPAAEQVAAARHLLEYVEKVPFLVVSARASRAAAVNR